MDFSQTQPSEESPPPATALNDFKRFFGRGLAALLPTVLTVALVMWAYELIDQHLGRFITNGMVGVFAAGGPPTIVNLDDVITYGTPIDEWDTRGRRLTEEYKIVTHPAANVDDGVSIDVSEDDRKSALHARNRALWGIAFYKYKLNLLGFLIAVIVVYFIGLFLASLIGRTTWRVAERLLHRVPLIRAIYPNIKQVTDFFLRDRNLQFSGVVAIQYPRKGVWSMGLTAGPPMPSSSWSTRQPCTWKTTPSASCSTSRGIPRPASASCRDSQSASCTGRARGVARSRSIR